MKSELQDLLSYLTPRERAEIDALLSDIPLTFRAFVRLVAPHIEFYVHVDQLCDVLQRVADDELHRLMIFMPPRHGKSELTSRLFTAYYLYKHPERWVGLSSYGAALAYNLSANARENFRTAGGALAGEGSELWTTQSGGGMWAAGVGGPITGRGYHLGLVDDPVKNSEEASSDTIREKHKAWWQSTFYTRQEPGAAIIVIQTRWHEDDLSGWLLKQEKDSEDNQAERWHVICMPAIAEPMPPFPPSVTVEPDDREPGSALCPERYNGAKLARIKSKVGDAVWAALYQQRPTPAAGYIFLRSWWEGCNRYYLNNTEIRNQVVARWLFFDTALKDGASNDFTACTVFELWPDYRCAVRHIFNERIQAAFLPVKIQELAQRWNYDGRLRAVVIEDKGSGTTAIQTLRASAPTWLAEMITEFTPTGTKEYRARQASIWCARDCVMLPFPDNDASWLYDFADDIGGQLFGFPATSHDDMVDAFTMGIIYLENLLAQGWQAREGMREQ